MRRFSLALLLTVLPVLAMGQTATRIDVPIQTYGPNVPVSGGPLPQTLWVANATVAVCSHPQSTFSACQASPIVTYTDSTEGTPCPSSTPLVLLPGNTCSASSGAAADLGLWYGGGTFDYFVVSSYGTFGPYTVSGSNGSGGTLPSNAPLISTFGNGTTGKSVFTGPNMGQLFSESQSVDARGGFSAANGVISCGDSILTSGTGHGAPVGQGVAPYIMTSIGQTTADLSCAVAGAALTDIAFFDMVGAPAPADRGNPAIISDGGTNDVLSGCLTSACLNGADQSVAAAISFFATGPSSKKWFTDTTKWAPSGAWNSTNPYVFAFINNGGTSYSVNDIVTLVGAGSGGTIKVLSVNSGVITGAQLLTPGVGYGYGGGNLMTASGGTGTGATFFYTFNPQDGFITAQQSTASGSCMTTATPLSFGQNGSVSLTYGALPLTVNGVTYTMANFTFSVDGTPWTDQITHSSSLSGNIQGVSRLIVGNPSWPFAPQTAVFTGIPAGNHTLSVCSTSSGLFEPLYAAVLTPYGTDSSDGPNYTQSAVPPEGGNANALASYDYSLETLHTIQLFNNLGMNNVNYVDQGWTTNSPGSPSVPVAMYWDTTRDFYGDTQVSLTSCAVTAGVASIGNTGSNTYTAGQQMFISGFTTGNCSQINTPVGSFYTVLSSGLSSSGFQVNVTPTTISSTTDTAGVSIRVTDGCVDSNNAPVHPDTCGAGHFADSFIYQMKLNGSVSGGGSSLVTSVVPPTGTTGSPAIGWGPKNFAGCTWSGANVPVIGVCQLTGNIPVFQLINSTGLAFQLSNAGSISMAGSISQTGASVQNTFAGPVNFTNNTYTWNSATSQALNFEAATNIIQLNWLNASAVKQWALTSGSTLWELQDVPNALFRIQLTENGVTDFTAGTGANAVRVGAIGTTAGTHGFEVWSGGATPAKVGGIDGTGTLTLSGGVGTTGTITGTSLTASCDSGTVSVTGAIVGHPVGVSSTTGADVGGAFDLRASVTSAGTVTVFVCGTGTPASLAYNVWVQP